MTTRRSKRQGRSGGPLSAAPLVPVQQHVADEIRRRFGDAAADGLVTKPNNRAYKKRAGR